MKNHTRYYKNWRAAYWCAHFFSAVSLLTICLLSSPAHASSTLTGEVIRATDASERSAFGYSISTSGNTAAVGSWFRDAGAVYVLQVDPDTGTWQETHRIPVPAFAEGQVNFGFDVALDGDQLVVGAPNILQSRPGGTEGFAFFYERDASNDTWELVTTIEGAVSDPDSDESSSQGWGRNVAIDQGLAAISRADKEAEVLVTYKQNPLTGNWTELDTFTFDAPTINGFSSKSIRKVAIHDGRMVLGINNDPGSGTLGLYIYEYDDEFDNWVEIDSIPSLDGYSGFSLYDDKLLVLGTGDAAPLFYTLDSASGNWVLDSEFDIEIRDRYPAGDNVDLDDTRIVLQGAADGGAIVYEENTETGRWEETLSLSAVVLGAGAPVTDIDLNENQVLLGIPYVDDFTGAVMSYRLDDQDSDQVLEANDNCPDDFNPTQENFDGDLLGDVCDLDDDNDGVDDLNDAYPLDPDRQELPEQPEPAQAPGIPTPAFPLGGNIELETAFRWPAVPSATYYVVEVQHNGAIRAYEPNLRAETACFLNQCFYVKGDAAQNGSNRWRLRAGNDKGVSEWSAWVDFFVGQSGPGGESPQDPAFQRIPEAPVGLAPVGNKQDVSDYVWAPLPGVINYAIEVQHAGEIRAYDASIRPQEACSVQRCTYTKSDAALLGGNRWRVRAINDVGSSAWSEWVDFTNSASATPPDDMFIPATPVPVPGSEPVDYRWSEVEQATVYSVEIRHMGEIRGYADDLNPAEICNEALCVFSKPDAALSGENRWRVRAGNENGFSAWSDWQTFTRP